MTLQINRAFYYASKQVHGMEAFDWLLEVGVSKMSLSALDFYN